MVEVEQVAGRVVRDAVNLHPRVEEENRRQLLVAVADEAAGRVEERAVKGVQFERVADEQAKGQVMR